MNKILVEIFLPAAEKSFDIYIPLESKMSEVLLLVSGLLSDLSNNSYLAEKDAIIFDAESGIIFNINKEVAELGIKNGSRLILV